MSSNKVKGLLKGLRYISQIFDNEKEQDMQIGLPTDVKHVAHIGWDGPSVNSPSWMNEFKASPSPGFQSAPLNRNGDVQNNGLDNSVKWVSEEIDSRRRSSRSVNSPGQQGRDLPELPKSSRRQSTGSITDSPRKEKSNKPRQSRKSSKTKDSSDGSKPTRQLMPTDSLEGGGSPARSLPDLPKRTHRKKPKDVSTTTGSSRLRSKAQPMDSNSDLGSPSGSVTKSRSKQRSFEEDGQYERGLSVAS